MRFSSAMSSMGLSTDGSSAAANYLWHGSLERPAPCSCQTAGMPPLLMPDLLLLSAEAHQLLGCARVVVGCAVSVAPSLQVFLWHA